MKTDLIALKAEAFSEVHRLGFLNAFGRMIYSGQGSSNTFGKESGFVESDGLRIFLGVPRETVTYRQRRGYEAVYAYVMGEPAVLRPQLWTDSPTWMPTNPRHKGQKPAQDRRLDLEFVHSFGLRRRVWEKEILMVDLDALKRKMDAGGDLSDTNLRLYIALAMFGFGDPDQFFV